MSHFVHRMSVLTLMKHLLSDTLGSGLTGAEESSSSLSSCPLLRVCYIITAAIINSNFKIVYNTLTFSPNIKTINHIKYCQSFYSKIFFTALISIHVYIYIISPSATHSNFCFIQLLKTVTSANVHQSIIYNGQLMVTT